MIVFFFGSMLDSVKSLVTGNAFFIMNKLIGVSIIKNEIRFHKKIIVIQMVGQDNKVKVKAVVST